MEEKAEDGKGERDANKEKGRRRSKEQEAVKDSREKESHGLSLHVSMRGKTIAASPKRDDKPEEEKEEEETIDYIRILARTPKVSRQCHR